MNSLLGRHTGKMDRKLITIYFVRYLTMRSIEIPDIFLSLYLFRKKNSGMTQE